MSIIKVKNTYVSELHSMFEGLAFIWVFLFGCVNLCMMLLASYVATLPGMSENNMLFSVSVALGVGFLYLLIATFSKIRSFAVECALAAWGFYIVAIFECGKIFSYQYSELFGSIGMAFTIGLITLTGFASLIVFLAIALRKSKYQNEELLIHTIHYKIYRFLRGSAFVILGVVFMNELNKAVIFPASIHVPMHIQEHFSKTNETVFQKISGEIGEYVKEHIQDFKYIIQRIVLIGGIEGILFILLGFFSSIFSLGIELICIGWSLLCAYVGLLLGFLYTVRYFIKYEIYTFAGLQTKMSFWHIYVFDSAVFLGFLVLLYFLIRIYIKRYNVQKVAQSK